MISVDTKKKELIGPCKNGGSDYRPQGCPDEVNVHDFVDKELGKAIPYGVPDIGANAGCVSVGIDHDTAEFAVNAIRRWRATMGGERYPAAGRLMITADGGGSNGSRVRLWKVELQKFADETGTARQRLSLSARHVEVEQDRAPPVLPHHAELARSAAHQSVGGRRVDRGDHDQERPDRPLRTRRQHIRKRRQGQRRRNGGPQHRRRRLPSRMELHHQATTSRSPSCEEHVFCRKVA